MSDREGGFERFCARVSPRLVGSLTLYCADRFLAEELAQEALVRAFERWARVGAMASPEAWTYRTAFNLARSSFRRSAAERRARSRMMVAPSLPDATDAIAVRAAVRALPARQRAVIVARFYLGLDVIETARVLGCRAGTVKAHTFKALGNLRAVGLVDTSEVTINDGSV
jgi:RNA polymerase sigma factor (sigma-70 family)